jgi:hypothetical protein
MKPDPDDVHGHEVEGYRYEGTHRYGGVPLLRHV